MPARHIANMCSNSYIHRLRRLVDVLVEDAMDIREASVKSWVG